MRHGRGSSLLVMPLLIAALFLVGCPKRPATTAASAPAPAAPAAMAPAAPRARRAPSTPSAPAPRAGRPPRPRRPPPRPRRRRAPSEFAENAALKDVYFDFDKYDIRPSDAKILDDNATWLKSNGNMLVLIEGHCDERGTNEYNLALGERRAKATMNYLVTQGVQANRITIISYGEERPVCTEKSESCWQRNRHAHFLVKAR